MTSPREYELRKRAEQIAEAKRRMLAGQSPTAENTTQNVTAQTAAFRTSNFAYGKDIGIPSIAGIELLARSSGLEIKVISTYRIGAKGYHGTQNAVDFGGSAQLRRQLAAYLYQFAQYTLELIYTDPGVPGGGFYVHNGKKVPQSFYDGPDVDFGGSIIDGHRDHVHFATTMSGLRAMSANSEQIAQQALEEAARQKPPPAGQSSNLLTGEPKSPQQLAAERSARRGCKGPAMAAVAVVSSIPIGILVLFM